MRTLYFLLPGTGGKFACGGLWAELKMARLAEKLCPVEIVTYRQREPDTLFLDDVLRQEPLDSGIFVLSWGFDVPKLARKIHPHAAVYHAHSAGYGFRLPPSIPIITVSRNTLGYWGQQAPHSLLYYLPNQISDEFYDRKIPRDIDVLVQARKSSSYLLKQLVPALKPHCNVFILDGFVDDLGELFNRSKLYLYDSSEYWAIQGVTEGFGLQPLEAIACGCHVFSSVNHGLSDYLDPGFNCQKIAGYSTNFDVHRILKQLQAIDTTPDTIPSAALESLLAEYRAASIEQKLRVILDEINLFFDINQQSSSDIQPLTRRRLWSLSAQAFQKKLHKRFRK